MFLPLFLAFAVRVKRDDPFTNPAPTIAPRPTAQPTAVSGVPSLPVIFCCTFGAICFIALCVSYLCFKKEQQQGFAQSAQILLEKNDI